MAFLSPMAASMSSLSSSRASAYNATLDDVDPETEMAPWFMAGVPRAEVRQVAMDMLKQGQTGNFLVRDVKSEPDCYGISIKNAQGKLVNYLIEKSTRKKDPGYQIRGTKQAFPTISELIKHYSAEKRAAFGIRLVIGDPHVFLADSSDEDGSGFNSDTSNSDRSDTAVEAPQSTGAKPLTDADRWAMNAQREEQRTLGRSTKGKSAKASIIKETRQTPPRESKPRKARQSSSQRSSTSRLEPRRRSSDMPYSLPQQQMQMQMQMQQMQLQQMQQMSPYGMMGSLVGAPALVPQSPYYPSPQGMLPQVSASELQIRAAEAHLAMMKAEADMYQAQLKAAETSLSLYKQRADDDAEVSHYDQQAAALARGNFSVRQNSEDGSAVLRNESQDATMEHTSSTGGSSESSQEIGSATRSQISASESERDRIQRAELDEQARLIELEAAELASAVDHMRAGSGNARDEDIVLSAAKKHARRKPRVSFSDQQVVPAPLNPPSKLRTKESTRPKQSGQRRRRSSEQYKVSDKARRDQLDKLRRLEDKELRRREAFDAQVATLVAEARLKPYSQRVKIDIKVDQLEQDEMERRKEWERNREEREAHYLMNAPDVGQHLEEYLAEREEQERLQQLTKAQQEEKARNLVGMGRVRRLADIFSQETGEDKDRKKSHVMTWKVKGRDTRPRTRVDHVT